VVILKKFLRSAHMLLSRVWSDGRVWRLAAMMIVLLVTSVVGAATGLTAGGTGATPALAGTISYGSFRSQALQGTIHYSVYLPAGYRAGTLRYPVVYFLHGLPAGADSYRSIQPIAQALEQSGRQAIVIGVQGSRSGDTDPEWLNWGPGRNWETATAKDLVRVVDSRYRTIATRSGRMLVGISGGGYGATLIGLHNPGVYSVVESWSGYFHPTNPAGTAPLDLGSEEANDWANAHKLIPKLRQLLTASGAQGYFAFYVGTNDSRFRAENEQFYREIRTAGIDRIVFRLYSGAHGWSLWSEHAETWLANGLAAAAKPR
jgi:S-formylglutathione hydrolase FrmB